MSAKDTLGALRAVGTILSVVEKAAIAFVMALLEFARIKQKKAEDALANKESDETITKGAKAIDAAVEGKTSADIVNDYLNDDVSDTDSKG